MRIISEKKELFVITLKGNIPEDKWEEYIKYTTIINSLEINNKSKKK
jgi:hypothetical protein